MISSTRGIRIDRVRFVSELKRRNMTQNRLTELSGVSRATLSSVSGGKSVSSDTAQKIADALQLPLEKLLERSDF
ncbi:MAG: helix-turn-helix domain-containing protein [Oscillospiraceae bacterium]|nr:helix-turn-helix domain-containing protein [Oscillospiraceae bacterium]